MVVKQSERATWSNRVPIQIGKHLLAAFKPTIHEEHYRNRFVS